MAKYSTARLVLNITAAVGLIAIIVGSALLVAKLTIGGSLSLYAFAALGIINGLAIVASAQLGFALLDTASSTRETADAMRELLRRQPASKPDVPAPPRGPSLRAER